MHYPMGGPRGLGLNIANWTHQPSSPQTCARVEPRLGRSKVHSRLFGLHLSALIGQAQRK
eukprot:1723542-Pleurochrysis_carterae.AAC.1